MSHSHFWFPQSFHKCFFRKKKGTPVFTGIPLVSNMVPKGGLDR
jgi:hypothetical protein